MDYPSDSPEAADDGESQAGISLEAISPEFASRLMCAFSAASEDRICAELKQILPEGVADASVERVVQWFTKNASGLKRARKMMSEETPVVVHGVECASLEQAEFVISCIRSMRVLMRKLLFENHHVPVTAEEFSVLHEAGWRDFRQTEIAAIDHIDERGTDATDYDFSGAHVARFGNTHLESAEGVHAETVIDSRLGPNAVVEEVHGDSVLGRESTAEHLIGGGYIRGKRIRSFFRQQIPGPAKERPQFPPFGNWTRPFWGMQPAKNQTP